MYLFLLTLHSIVRWILLISLTYTIWNSFKGWKKEKVFSKRDAINRQATVSIARLQFTLGILLYIVSPVTRYFLSNFSKGVHIRDIRFFGMEHITMMVIAVALITIGGSVSRKKTTDNQKHKAIAVWFTIALVIIFLSIPWPFSPFTARPFLRF